MENENGGNGRIEKMGKIEEQVRENEEDWRTENRRMEEWEKQKDRRTTEGWEDNRRTGGQQGHRTPDTTVDEKIHIFNCTFTFVKILLKVCNLF